VATGLVLPLNKGKAFSGNEYLFPLYLIAICYFYFGWCWTHGGQTLGMRTWKIKLQAFDRQPVSWKKSLIRFIGSLLSWSVFGLGYFWMLIDKNHYSWHDYLSETSVYLCES